MCCSVGARLPSFAKDDDQPELTNVTKVSHTSYAKMSRQIESCIVEIKIPSGRGVAEGDNNLACLIDLKFANLLTGVYMYM